MIAGAEAVDDRKNFLKSRGLKIPNDPKFITRKLRRALRRDEYELKESQAAQRLAEESDVVLELGGGIGYMGAFLSAVGKVSHVHSFEANKRLRSFAERLHALNNIENITIHNALLAPQDGPAVNFYVREDFLASSMSTKRGDDDSVRIDQVEVRDINKVIAEIKPTFLVCDIEGAEAHLLPKANFETLRAAAIELHPRVTGSSGVRAVFEAMHAAGLTYDPFASIGRVVAFRQSYFEGKA